MVCLAGGAYGLVKAGVLKKAKIEGPATVLLSGVLEARETDLRAESSGRVTQIACRDGERVAEGDLILRIDPRAPEAELLAAAGALAAGARSHRFSGGVLGRAVVAQPQAHREVEPVVAEAIVDLDHRRFVEPRGPQDPQAEAQVVGRAQAVALLAAADGDTSGGVQPAIGGGAAGAV